VSGRTEPVDVHGPIRTTYNLWKQFGCFPAFMNGVESIGRGGVGLCVAGDFVGVGREVHKVPRPRALVVRMGHSPVVARTVHVSASRRSSNRVPGGLRSGHRLSLAGWVRPSYRRSPWLGPTLAAFVVLGLLYSWAAPVPAPGYPSVGRPGSPNPVVALNPPAGRR
jgi:hypothetical protein